MTRVRFLLLYFKMIQNTDKEKIQILTHQLNLKRLETAYDAFIAQNIEPVLIKGLASAQNYPKSFQRTFSDIDLAVDPKEYDAAGEIIRVNQFNIDLHRGLRHLDTLEWDELFKRTRFIKASETKIRVLGPEDHLRVLCVHWLNDGGADRTRLWDVFFALENRPSDFDWERFLFAVEPKRRQWLLTVIDLAKNYLGLELEENYADSHFLPEWVKRQVENEWKSDERLIPLHQILRDRRRLLRQVFKRIPPNELQAVVENNAAINNTSSISVRFINLIKRTTPSVRRILGIEGKD